MSILTARKSASRPKLRVLLISDDPNLSISRLLLLDHHHYEAEHYSSAQLPDLPDLEGFCLFLICQSIVPETATALMRRIRSNSPHARILRVRSGPSEKDELAELYLDSPAPPGELIRAVESLSNMLPRAGGAERK